MLRTVILATLLAGSAPVELQADQAGPGFVVFGPDKIEAMLRQCSRAAPRAGEGSWVPTESDIERMEPAVAAAIAPMAKANPRELDGFPDRFGRQYIGIIRKGRRYIYGNFAPPFILGEYGARWRTTPFMVCDGGVGLFGAEFDLETGKITQLDFNGYA